MISRQVEVRTHPEARAFLERLTVEVESAGFDEQAAFAIRLAMDEAVANGLKHGNGEDPAKRVQIRYQIDAHGFEATVEDEGNGFDPSKVPDPTHAQYIERPCGRGVMLMRAYMSDVVYHAEGSRVTLRKRRGCRLPVAS